MPRANLLIKLPSRQRPGTLLKAARLYADMAEDKRHTRLLVSLDNDDTTVSTTLLRMLARLSIPATVLRGERTSKIGAVNRDLPGPDPWDLLLVASDDQWPVVPGYDNRIRLDFETHWPEGDGALWYHDGHQDRICTQSIMDRRYYDRDGYLYYPGYHSYCSDVEWTEVALARGRLVKSPHCLIRHEHPCWNGMVRNDALYDHNRRFKVADRKLLEERQKAGYP